jgi:hypothetical protein
MKSYLGVQIIFGLLTVNLWVKAVIARRGNNPRVIDG